MPINCWVFLAVGVLGVIYLWIASRYLRRHEPLPNCMAPDWICGKPTCDPETAPLTVPARCALVAGPLVGIAFVFVLTGTAIDIHTTNWFAWAFVIGVAALVGWWGYHGSNFCVRWVMVRRANPFEVFIAGAAGAVVSVWFHSGAGSGSSSSSSSSSSSDDRSSGGGRFGGGGASGSW